MRLRLKVTDIDETPPVNPNNHAGKVVINGVPTQGETLSSTVTDVDGLNGVNIGYQWKRDGENIAQAEADKYELTLEDVGAVITVEVKYTDEANNVETIVSQATNDVIGIVVLENNILGKVSIDGVSTEGETLNSIIVDSDGVNGVTINYQWQRNDVDISGANAPTYILGTADIDKAIKVRVSYVDEKGSSENLTSDASETIAAKPNLAPDFGATPFEFEVAENQLAVGTVTAIDPEGAALTYTLLGADKSLFKIGLDTGVLTFDHELNFEVNTDTGGAGNYQVSVVASDGINTAQHDLTVTLSDVNDAPTGVIEITGVVAVGGILSINYVTSVADEDGQGSTAKFWQRDGVDIVGEQGSTYTLVEADLGAVITVAFRYSDGKQDEEFISTPTGVVGAANTAATGVVAISDALQGEEMSVDISQIVDVDGNGAGTVYTYQWQRNGVDIDGATAATYNPIQADVGEAITVDVSFHDEVGFAETLSSNGAAITNVNDLPTGAITITGELKEDEQVSADLSAFVDLDGLPANMFFTWNADGVAFSTTAVNSVVLGQGQVGKHISVNVSYTDLYGKAEEFAGTATAGTVVNINDAPTGNASISGEAKQGETLTALNNFVDEDGPGSVVYQWVRDGVDVDGTTGNTYVLTQADVGKTFVVKAAFTDGFGDLTNHQSAATEIVHVGAAVVVDFLDGDNGFKFVGEAAGDEVGFSVSGTGDVNGDGYDDFVVSARFHDITAFGNEGASYVVFGTGSAFDADFELAKIYEENDPNGTNGTLGFKLVGDAGDYLATQVSGAVDVNGDGYDDVLVSSNNASNSGAGYVVYGKADFTSQSYLQVSTLTGTNGFIISGNSSVAYLGISSAGAGDVNGDGFDDLIVGDHDVTDSGSSINGAGATFLIFGGSTGANVAVGSLNGTNGMRFDGEAINGQSALYISEAGDINGDGYADILIAAPNADHNAFNTGSVYVVFGSSVINDGYNNVNGFNLDTLSGADGFRIDGENESDHLEGVSSAGDVNGDGYDDIIVTSPRATANGNDGAGSSYVIFGKSAFGSEFLLNSLNGTNGFRLDGELLSDKSGVSPSSVGDINGDGYDDIAVMAEDADHGGDRTGSAYIIYGQEDFSDQYTEENGIDLSSLDGGNGFRIDGLEADDNLNKVSDIGDFNRDGYDDILLGSRSLDANGALNTGGGYVVYGGEQFSADGAAAHAGDDTLGVSDSSSGVVVGGGGNDTLSGNDSADVLIGGSGDDIFRGDDSGDILIGGSGADTFIIGPGETDLRYTGTGDNAIVTGFDVIKDFEVGDGTHVSEKIEIIGGSAISRNSNENNVVHTSALTIGGDAIQSHEIDGFGMITFDTDAVYDGAIEISSQNELATVVLYLQEINLGKAAVTVGFDVGADTFIYVQGSSDGANNGQDILVRLEGAEVDSLNATNGFGEFDLFIA